MVIDQYAFNIKMHITNKEDFDEDIEKAKD